MLTSLIPSSLIASAIPTLFSFSNMADDDGGSSSSSSSVIGICIQTQTFGFNDLSANDLSALDCLLGAVGSSGRRQLVGGDGGPRCTIEELLECEQQGDVDSGSSSSSGRVEQVGRVERVDKLYPESGTPPPPAPSSFAYYPFKLPLHYQDPETTHPISEIVSKDLELSELNFQHNLGTEKEGGVVVEGEPDEKEEEEERKRSTMYESLLSPSHQFGRGLLKDWDSVFSSDVEFLTETQEVVEQMEKYNLSMVGFGSRWGECEDMMEIWDSVKRVDEQEFLEKYMYIDWTAFKSLNHSSDFLQTLSMLNLSSPLMSLLMPVFMILIPFLVLKVRGIPVTYEMYLETLKDIAKNHFLGKALTCFEEPSISLYSLAYLMMIVAMYVLQMYHNAKSVMSFYTNISKINRQLCSLKQYLQHSLFSMKTFWGLHCNKKSYRLFLQDMSMHVETLETLSADIGELSEFNESVSKIFEFGHLLKCYYSLHADAGIGASLMYSFGFEGYMNHLRGLHRSIKCGQLSFMRFNFDDDDTETGTGTGVEDETGGGEKAKGNVVLVDQYYASFKESSTLVKTDCRVQPNMILSGPNASGKTTFLKTTLLNLLFTQQVGCGFYSHNSSVKSLYTHLHSYLNIPDTSERDSLFQAESRRCKEIIDKIERSGRSSSRSDRHFCIFDELYSGTNPHDAVRTATGFLKYLLKRDNVDFILTTHYEDICRYFEGNNTPPPIEFPNIANFQMDVSVVAAAAAAVSVGDSNNDTQQLAYTYKTKEGVSTVRGSVNILRKMNYPEEILKDLDDRLATAAADSSTPTSEKKT